MINTGPGHDFGSDAVVSRQSQSSVEARARPCSDNRKIHHWWIEALRGGEVEENPREWILETPSHAERRHHLRDAELATSGISVFL